MSRRRLLMICLSVLWSVPGFAQTEPKLLFPFNELQFEPAKQAKALEATQEYQTNEQQIKENEALPNSDRQKMRTANYQSYLKAVQGLLNKDQRKKSIAMLVENDVKGLRQKPVMPRFYDQLDLNEKQTAKAQEWYLQQRIKTQTLYHTGDYSPQQRSEESKFIGDDFKYKFDGLLNDQQRAKLAGLTKHAQLLATIPVPPAYQKLNLSSSQTEKLRQVIYDRQAKLDALRKDPAYPSGPPQQEVSRINLEASQNADAILTRDQKIKFEDLQNEANYQMPSLYAQLELSSEQLDKLKEALLWQAHEQAVIRMDPKLSDEQKQQRRTQVTTALKERLSAFMTPAQMSKLMSLLGEMKK